MSLIVRALSSGALADKIGRKWVLAYGDVWFTLGAIIICSSFSVAQMIVGRFVLGVGESSMESDRSKR
jgi:SP family myo-inositol transporter-like MFS transporter 13